MRGIFPAMVVLIAAPATYAEQAADTELTLTARELLRQDQRLKQMSVCVSISDGVATLWGAVPDASLADIAEAKLRQLPGVRAVRNETYQLRTDPIVERVRELMRAIELPKEPELVVPPPKVRKTPVDLASHQAPPTPKRPAATLLAPVPLVRHTAPAVPVPLPQPKPRPVAAPVSHRSPVLGTYALLEEACQKERRFIGVRLDLRDGVVYVSGQVRQLSDGWDLAEILSEVPGVRRVILRDIYVP